MWKFLNSIIALIFQISSSGSFLCQPFFFFFWLSISGGSHSALIHKLSLSYLSQVSPRPRISLAWLLLLFLCCPQPQSRGGLEGLQDRARLREAMFRHPAPSRQQPRPQALWPMQCTPGSSVISPSVSREAAIRACVPGQLSSLLNAPFCTCFSFSATAPWLREQSLGAQQPPWQAECSLQKS